MSMKIGYKTAVILALGVGILALFLRSTQEGAIWFILAWVINIYSEIKK